MVEFIDPMDWVVESANPASDQYKQSSGKFTMTGVKRLGGAAGVIPTQIDGLPVTVIGTEATTTSITDVTDTTKSS